MDRLRGDQPTRCQRISTRATSLRSCSALAQAWSAGGSKRAPASIGNSRSWDEVRSHANAACQAANLISGLFINPQEAPMSKKILVKAIYKTVTPTEGFILALAELVTVEVRDDDASKTTKRKHAQPITTHSQVAVRDDADT
jgi:hypothetical protein